ncbi:MAG: galactokinase [Acidobacteriota bacterium]|nr:galactokinase [Acidobacteriota bacterium]
MRRFFVPGRLEVFGKHTDYAGGHTLVAAVPRGFTVHVTGTADGVVRVTDTVSGEQQGYPSEGHAQAHVGWRRYPASVVKRLAANFPGTPLSARIDISSDLPRASGISSSSAFVVSIAEALVSRARIDETDAWRRAVLNTEDRASYYACIENGATFRELAGDAGVGTHGGSEDHAAILGSRAGHLTQYRFSPLRREQDVAMPAGWTFVIATTGVRARKAGAAREAYNRAAASAAAVHAAWRARHPGDPRSLGDLVHEEALRSMELSAVLRARLEHFLAEDARVVLAAGAFARADAAMLGDLAADSQRDADVLLANQVPETRALVDLARDNGAHAASGFGAGWGGSVWALVSGGGAEGFLDAWLASYRAAHPHLPSTGFLAPPADGLRAL